MTVRELQNQLLEVKRTSASNSVGAARFTLQQELAKPPPVFDPYKALAGLESLVDLARDNADARTKRFSTILRQCRPLLGKPQFQSTLLKLVGDKEDVEVAKAIQKSLRPSASWGPSMASRPPGPGFSHRTPDFRYAPRPPPTSDPGVSFLVWRISQLTVVILNNFQLSVKEDAPLRDRSSLIS